MAKKAPAKKATSKKAAPKKKRTVRTRTPRETVEKAAAEIGFNPDTVRAKRAPKAHMRREQLKKDNLKPHSKTKKPKSKRVAHTAKERKNHPLAKLDRSKLKVPPLPESMASLRMGYLTAEEAVMMAEWWQVEPDFRASPHRVEALLKHIQNGNFLEDSAILCGVSGRMMVAWRTEGRNLEEQGFTDTLAVGFLRATEAAESQAKNRALVGIQLIGQSNWNAMAWWLKKRFPHQFCDQVKVEVEDTTPPEPDEDPGEEALPEEEIDGILERMYGSSGDE